MARVLLTGGRGLLGTPLTERLSGRYDVVVTDVADLDVTDAGAVRSVLAEAAPDHVVHLAAWTDVDGCESDREKAELVNGDGTRNVAVAAAGQGASLLYVSTDYVFPGDRAGPRFETEPVRPLSVYGASKLAGERAATEAYRGSEGRLTIARCQSIYGAGKKSFVDAILGRARSGEPLSVVTDQRVSPSWAEDLATALAGLLSVGSPGVFHVANRGGCSWFECARTALDLVGLTDVPIRPISARELARPAPRPGNSEFDCGRLARVAGIELPTWQSALERYLGCNTPGVDA